MAADMDPGEVVEFAAAIDLLRVLLRNGPREADHCENVALLVGIDIRLFRNARAHLGIEETNYVTAPEAGPEDCHGFWHFGRGSVEQLERWRADPRYLTVANWMPPVLRRPEM